MLLIVSTQPLIEVNGVRSSWLTEEMNSFFNRSVSARSSAIWLMVLHRRPISSSYRVSGRRTFMLPLAIRVAVASTSPRGRTMERTKNSPLQTVKHSTSRPSPTQMATVRHQRLSTSTRLVTIRIAAMLPAA